MQHRAHGGVALACEGGFESASTPARLHVSPGRAHTAIGCANTMILQADAPQPVRTGEGWFCLDGRIVADRMLVGTEEAAQLLKPRLNAAGFSSIEREIDGAYSACFCTSDELFATRDPLGLKPLFMGRQDELVAVASERKALWVLGIHGVSRLRPGCSLTASSDGPVVDMPDFDPIKPISSGEADADELSQALVESVRIQTAKAGKIALGFSGGIDSTILAIVARDAGVDVLPVTVGLGMTREMMQARSTAKEIGLPITVGEFSKHDLEECLDHVLWLVEEPELMKVGIAVAIHWTAKVAIENDRRIILLGQGSDELFGGYKRFATILGERGKGAALQAISDSIRNAHEVNYEGDELSISSLPAELRLPFASRQVVELASRVPLQMMVRSPTDNVRKWVLREAAVKLGVPTEISLRPKKAIQYASGIERAIRDLAKENGQAPPAYLQSRLGALKDRLDATQL